MANLTQPENPLAPANRVWHKGPPPHIGWWNASCGRNLYAWRWWNGRYWSETCVPGMPASQIARDAKTAFNDLGGKMTIEWTDFYPANARVPRIDPTKPKAGQTAQTAQTAQTTATPADKTPDITISTVAEQKPAALPDSLFHHKLPAIAPTPADWDGYRTALAAYGKSLDEREVVLRQRLDNVRDRELALEADEKLYKKDPRCGMTAKQVDAVVRFLRLCMRLKLDKAPHWLFAQSEAQPMMQLVMTFKDIPQFERLTKDEVDAYFDALADAHTAREKTIAEREAQLAQQTVDLHEAFHQAMDRLGQLKGN